MAFARSTPKMVGSGRLGQSSTKDSVYVRFDAAPLINLINQETNKFRSGAFYKALTRANERAAIATQNAMVESINRQVRERGRPQRPGQRLVTAMGSEKNREVFANTFSVGLENWLEQSPAALYYRQIDEGMDAFTPHGGILFTNNGFGSGNSSYGPPYVRPSSKFRGSNLRMPQFASRGVIVAKVGPYPAFHYVQAAKRAHAVYPMRDVYIEELRAAGFAITKDIFKVQK